MICPKCNSKLPEGMLYCEKCGTEINIVPDFVPEIETKLEELKPDLNSLEPTLDIPADEVKAKRIIDSEFPVSDYSSKNPVKGSGKKLLIGVIASICVLALVSVLAVMVYHDNSPTYQCKKGDEQYDKGNIKQAVSYYEKAVNLNPRSLDYRMRLADCYIELENIERAISEYMELVILEPNNSLAYAQIISLYEKIGDYASIAEFLGTYGTDDIRSQYVDYLATEPEFSIEEGEYDEAISLTLTNPAAGKIFYTTDGTTPNESSFVYSDPIFLNKGDYEINAIFQNEYGVFSSVVSKSYIILAEAPIEPVVSLDSGTYDSPQLIHVIIPDGCQVYYTLDGSVPDESSRIYGEPIPLDKGISHYSFASINEDHLSSPVVYRDYTLEISASFTEDEGVAVLYQGLVARHYLKDVDGSSENYPGIFSYLYSELRNINGLNVYCYNEYYVYGSGARAMTSNIFGVDVNTGDIYLVKKDSNNNYTLNSF